MAIDDAYTKSLLHMDGADASTTFADESGKSWTRNGDAQIDTAQYKFGGASGVFDGTGDSIKTADSDDFNTGAGDFTIDMWVKKAANNVLYRLCGQSDASATISTRSTCLILSADNTAGVEFFTNAGGAVTAGTSSVVDTNWHHIAVVRYANALNFYLDGVGGGGAGDVTGLTANNPSGEWYLGRHGLYIADLFAGWIDEFRFSKGIARWTSNFIPPTHEYPFWYGNITPPMWFA
jgi:hypothetical protein